MSAHFHNLTHWCGHTQIKNSNEHSLIFLALIESDCITVGMLSVSTTVCDTPHIIAFKHINAHIRIYVIWAQVIIVNF